MRRGIRVCSGGAVYACFAAVACSSSPSGPGSTSSCFQNTAELDIQNRSGEDISIEFNAVLDGGLPNPLVLASGAEMDGLMPSGPNTYDATRKDSSKIEVQSDTLDLSCGVKTVIGIEPELKDNLSVLLGGTGFGTVTSDPPGIDCSTPLAPGCYATFLPQTKIALILTADPGSTAMPASAITITQDVTVPVQFTADHESFDVAFVGGAGSVVSSPPGLSCSNTDYTSVGEPCEGFFRIGTVVTLSASAAVGSQFGGFTGGSCTGDLTCTFTTADVAPPHIDANFSP